MVRHEVVGIGRHQGFGFLDRAFHAFPGGREDELGAVGGQQTRPLHTHALRHDQNELIPANGGDQGQAYASITAGRLYNGSAGFEFALAFRLINHIEAYAVFHGAARVEILDFGIDRRATFLGQSIQSDQGRATD